MFSIILPLLGLLYLASVTGAAYYLGRTKTENARAAALTGFLLAFLPPLALVYLAILVFKEDVDIV